MKSFYWSIAGLFGLVGVVWAIATLASAYSEKYQVFPRVTSPNTWEKICLRERMLLVGQMPIYYSEVQLPFEVCQEKGEILAKVTTMIEAECPGGACEQPGGPTEGRMMKLFFEELQVTE